MDFKQAFTLLKRGALVKLPTWAGYWSYDGLKDQINMHTKDGEVVEIRETTQLTYTIENILSDQWMTATEENTPLLGGKNYFDIKDAMRYILSGNKISKKGNEDTYWMKDTFKSTDGTQYLDLIVRVRNGIMEKTMRFEEFEDYHNKTFFNLPGLSPSMLVWCFYEEEEK